MDQQQDQVADEKKQLDAVLDAALDELDEDDKQEESIPLKNEPQQTQNPSDAKGSISRPTMGPEERPPQMDMASLDDVMSQLFQAGESGNPDAALDSFMKQLQSQLASELEKVETCEPNSADSPETSSSAKRATQENATAASSAENNVDRTISKLLDDMATANTQDDGPNDEAMFQDMMKEFEQMGGAFDQDAMVDGMMQQLLAKEIMYEPMKQVTEKFPSWLEEKKDILTEEEYRNRTKQYECFQKLICVYEEEPNNVEKLMQLMQDMQEHGQPPPEIVQEIAPGLELDEEGIPKLDAMGGMPFGENEECRIM